MLKPFRHKPLLTAGTTILVLLAALKGWRLAENWHISRLERRYLPLVTLQARKHRLPRPLLQALIWKESRWQSDCRGSKGEIGLMQIMSGAVADWSRSTGNPIPSPQALQKPEINLEIGSWYLAQAGRRWQDYRAREILQLADYNAGYSRVAKLWKPQHKNHPLPLEKISFPGTRSYIKQIIAKKADYEAKYPDPFTTAR